MYIYKILGTFLIIFSCIMLAQVRIREHRAAINALTIVIRGIRAISDKISFTLTPLPDIIKSLENTEDEFFWGVVTELSHGALTVGEAWITAAGNEDITLPDGARRILKNLGQSLGSLPVELETENLERTARELEAVLSEETELLEKNVKVIKTFGLLGGILIVILLI